MLNDLPVEAVNPDEERRRLIQAALAKSLAPAADNTEALRNNEAKANVLQGMSDAMRVGSTLSSAIMGRSTNGDNLGSQILDPEAKNLLAKNLEMKNQAAEAEKRRAEIAKAFGMQDVQDAAQLDRQNKNNADQIKRDDNQNQHTVGRDGAKYGQEEKMAGINHGYRMEEIGLQNKGKVDAKGVNSKPLPTPIVDKLAGYDTALASSASIRDYMAEKGIKPGKFTTMYQDFTKNFGTNSPEYARFQAEVGSNLAEYIRAMSGAATSDSERAELKKNTPNADDSPATFAAKAEWFEDYVAKKRGILLTTLKKSNYDTSKFDADGLPQTPAPQQGAQKTLVKKQQNKQLNKTRFIYSDGSEEIKDGLQ